MNTLERTLQCLRDGSNEIFVDAVPNTPVAPVAAFGDRAIDLTKPGKVAPLDAAAKKLYTRPTALLPTDGLVKATALEITRGATSDLDKARAISTRRRSPPDSDAAELLRMCPM